MGLDLIASCTPISRLSDFLWGVPVGLLLALVVWAIEHNRDDD